MRGRGTNKEILEILTDKLVCNEMITAVDCVCIRGCDWLRYHFCQFVCFVFKYWRFINFVIITFVRALSLSTSQSGVFDDDFYFNRV